MDEGSGRVNCITCGHDRSFSNLNDPGICQAMIPTDDFRPRYCDCNCVFPAPTKQGEGNEVVELKHSPLPWTSDSDGFLYDAGGERIADLFLNMETQEKLNANAALIVAAVNAYHCPDGVVADAEITRLTNERNQLAIQGGDLFTVCRELARVVERAFHDFDVLICRGDLTEEPRAYETRKQLAAALTTYNAMKGQRGD